MAELGLLFVSMLWALSTMAVKLLTGSMNVYLIGICKIFFAVVSLCFFALLKRKKINIVRDKWVLIGGIGYAISQIFLNLGLNIGYAHSAIVTYAFETIFITIYSHLSLSEKVNKIDIISIVMCISGIFLINFNNVPIGEVLKSTSMYLFMIAGLGISLSTISNKNLVEKYESLDYIFSIHIVTFILLVPSAIFTDGISDFLPLLNIKTVFLNIFLGINSSLALYIFSKMLTEVKFIRAVILTKSILIFNILFSKMFFNEKITSITLFGMLVITVGMVILSINGKIRENHSDLESKSK